MSGFLYFLPNVRGQIDYKTLDLFGLSYVLDDKSQHFHRREVISNGPGSMPGMVVGHPANWQVEEVKQSESIEWVKMPKTLGQEGKQAWLGWVRDQLPKPANLARVVQLPGEWLTLADENKWQLPIARKATGQCALPCLFDIDEDSGEWIATRVRREYAKLWQYTNECYLTILHAAEAEAGQYELPDYERIVTEAIQANYRVSSKELAILGVLDTSIAHDVVNVLLDLKGFEALKKNREPDTGDGSSGPGV
jgi:hypothetical protein